MNKKIIHFLSVGILSTGVAVSSLTAFAAKAWTMPETGLRLTGEEKQAYVLEQMEPLFHPREDAVKVAPAPFAPPDGWCYDVFDVDGVKTERLTNPKLKKGRIVLQLHGGGYISGESNRHRELAVKQGILSEARETYMVNYRLAPEHAYPAALEDAVKVYRYLLAQGNDPKGMILMGDSAGGNLVLALSLYLKAEKLPQPALLILASPWATFEADIPSRSANAKRDLILGTINPRMYNEVQNPSYGNGLSPKDPRLSPIYADLSELPPMLIQTGGYEMFLDENIALAKKAAEDGVDVTLTVYGGMSHDFALMLPEMQDSVDSFQEIRDFVGRHMK